MKLTLRWTTTSTRPPLVELARGVARCERFTGRYLSLIAVVLALFVATLSWAAGDSAERSWRDNWRVVAALVAGLADAGKRELCADGLVDYFRQHPEFAPEWFRAACAPLVIDHDWEQGLSPSLQERL